MADTELNLEAALAAVERRLPAMLEDAKYEWGEACGGPSEHEIYAQKILSAVRDELSRAATKAAAPADAPELAKLRDRVAELEAMLDARLERKPDNSQEWAKVDGAVAFHLIERHADDWNDAGRMMDAWRDANPRRATSVPAVPGTGREKEGQFFNFNVPPTLTNEQEAAAERGYCPVCNALELYEVNAAHGMRFCQCNHCKDIVVLATPSYPSEAKAGEDA